MFVDLWGWFSNCETEAIQKGDMQRLRLVTLAREGWDYRRLAQGDKALDAFGEGLKIAQRLNEPCWEAFHRFWIAVIHHYQLYDYQAALDETVRLVAEIRKERYAACPVRGAIVYLLAKIYFTLDFNGYESEIKALLEYLEKEVGMDEDTYLQLLVTYIEIEMHHQRYESAEAKAQDLINRSTGWNFRLYDAYRSLRRIAFVKGQLVEALDYNRIAQKYTALMMMQNCIAAEKLWEAVLLKYLGEDGEAREKYYLALAHYEQYSIPRDNDYLSANAEYLELDRQIDAALKSQEALLPAMNARPSIASLFDAYWSYIALLARNKRDFAELLEKAKAIANSSRKPEHYLQRLAYIEQGNYFDFEWQKNSRKNTSA
jgi:hypothetical protein